MKVNTEALSDSKDKAEAFNKFFLSHSNVDVSQDQLPQKGNVEYKLVSVKASEQEVLDLLMSLDTTKATGPDGIGPKLLYEAVTVLLPCQHDAQVTLCACILYHRPACLYFRHAVCYEL